MKNSCDNKNCEIISKCLYSNNLTISMKTQIWYSIKINALCRANQQILHYSVSMAINAEGMLFSQYNLLHCFFFFVFIRTPFYFFFLKNFVLPSPCGMQSALRWFAFDMHNNIKTPRDVAQLQAGRMGFVRTGHWSIKSRHFNQAGDNILDIYVSILF